MSTPTLTRAAELLEARASELLLSNTNDDGAWNDDAEAREDHDEMLRVAGELRAMVEAAQPKHSAIERAIKTLTHVEDCLLRDAPDDIQAAEVERACAGLRESAHQADANTDLRSALNDALELRRQLTLMEEHARGEVWRWQGDGTDSLETMGNRMGVLIFASDLRALLEAAQPADVARLATTKAARDVLAERQRQIDAEGWTPEHDDEHSMGGLAVAAACYATAYEEDPVPSLWPWEDSWWKPKDRRSNRVRACALLLAEIERLDRAALAAKGADHG